MKGCSTMILLALSWWMITPEVRIAGAQSANVALSEDVASSEDFAFEQVLLPGGYVSNFVNGMAQDSQGFLWLATRAWLIRYDGYETKTYRPNPQDSSSIAASKWVEAVYVDSEGTLWVGTFGGGLDRFDSSTETFTHFRHDPRIPTSLSGDTVTVMLEASDGALWIGTHQGLNRMDRETGTFTRFRHDPKNPTSLSNDQVRALFEDRQGTLWIGTGSPWGGETPLEGGGLNRFNPATASFTRFVNDPADVSSLSSNHVTDLFEDTRGTFWVGTSGDGLHSMDRENGTFTRHLYDAKDPKGLSMPHLDEFSGPAYVSVVHEDVSGNIWIGAINGGLSRYDPETGDAVAYAYTAGNGSRFGSTFVSDMFESREGALWVATWNGLFKIVRPRDAFRRHRIDVQNVGGLNSVKAALEDREGALWIGTESGGLSRIDGSVSTDTDHGGIVPAATRYVHNPRDPRSLSDNSVLALHESRDGSIWVGTATGLHRLDRETGRFERFRHDPADPTSLAPGQVFSIVEGRQGAIWVGVYGGGLSRFDPALGRFTNYVHDPAIPQSLSDNDVSALLEDSEGVLWVGTLRGGINRLDPRDEWFARYPYPVSDASGLSDGFITTIYEDDAGMLWFGTMLGGLNRFDRSTGRFTHFTSANSGLPDNRIQGILSDSEGNLWVSTGNGAGSGLARFHPAEGRFFTYDTGLILPTGTTFPGVLERRNGEMIFGGDNGLVAFSPTELLKNASRNAHPPQVLVTGFSLLNRADGVQSPWKHTVLADRTVRLSHHDNTFSLDFVGLHFDDPARNQYSYMLEGYDDTWRAEGSGRQAAYYKVPPGDYTFRVKAANSDGIWTEQGASMQIVIRPPWWRTWWAYVLYGATLLGGVLVVDRVQRRRVREGERRRSAMREVSLRAELAERQSQDLEVLDRAKSRFFANISHEFRTPLTLVLGPIRDLIDGQIDAQRLATLAPLMHRNAARLLQLINQLLDLSRLDADGMHLNARRQDAVAFLRRHVLTFTSRVERDGVALVFAADPDEIEMDFDADKLETVITNLLSNAFKFTPSGGRIRVKIQLEDEDVVITVRDSGEGMTAESLPHVFDRFYQADTPPMRGHTGTGIGLALAKELVELHDGTIGVESERGFGTIFTVRMARYRRGEGETAPPDRTEDALDAIAGRVDTDEYDFEEAVPLPIEAALPTSATAPTILIVEDNDDMREYLRAHLGGAYRLLEAEDGVEGLRLASEERPDLVISDVMMPGMDGFALCQAIKSDERTGHIPVVLLTARADEVSRIEGLRTGADAYLAKPFSFEELMTRVENLVEIRRRLRERFSDEVRLGPDAVVVTSADAAFVERVRTAIEEEMANSTFGVSQLAEAVGVSERQLHRRIKETAGLTPAAYIRMMRLERAAQLFEQQAGRVSDVAYAVGFNSPKYFSRLYRQTFGHAPSDEAGSDLP